MTKLYDSSPDHTNRLIILYKQYQRIQYELNSLKNNTKQFTTEDLYSRIASLNYKLHNQNNQLRQILPPNINIAGEYNE